MVTLKPRDLKCTNNTCRGSYKREFLDKKNIIVIYKSMF